MKTLSIKSLLVPTLDPRSAEKIAAAQVRAEGLIVISVHTVRVSVHTTSVVVSYTIKG